MIKCLEYHNSDCERENCCKVCDLYGKCTDKSRCMSDPAECSCSHFEEIITGKEDNNEQK